MTIFQAAIGQFKLQAHLSCPRMFKDVMKGFFHDQEESR